MKLLIKQGHLLDPKTNRDGVYDLLIEEGLIADIGDEINEQADYIINAAGNYVMPGLIDLHVHLREPGYEYKETIQTGAAAAAKGGYTTICAMPNTNPATDNVQILKLVQEKAKKEAVVNVEFIGAVTCGQDGTTLTDIAAMAKQGICAISEDGKSVMATDLYLKGMQLAKENNIPVFAHCEDRSLVRGGVINAGAKAKEYGLNGITNAVEDVIAARDILLAKEAGCQLHLCHCSTKDSVTLVKMAKEMGLPVTAEVCPHHFAMADEEIAANHGDYKMNPPLRSREDVEALKQGLKDGVMEVIATDHAPHGWEENDQSFEKAPFGIVGLETALALTMTELVEKGWLTKLQMVDKMSYQPAKVLGINKGTLEVGSVADVVIADLTTRYQIDKNNFVSKGKNTPFDNKEVVGKVLTTIVEGNVVYQGGL